MRQETRLIKEILKFEYPDKKFKFRYKTTHNYIDSSDTLIIICERRTDIENIISTIKKYVDGIKVFKQGDIACIFNRYIESQILSIKTQEWIDAGLMEFIEIREE